MDYFCLFLVEVVRVRRLGFEEFLVGVDNNLVELEVSRMAEKEVLVRLRE